MSDVATAAIHAFVGDPQTSGNDRLVQTADTQSQHTALHEDRVVSAIGDMDSQQQLQMIGDISRRMTELRAIRIGETHVGSN